MQAPDPPDRHPLAVRSRHPHALFASDMFTPCVADANATGPWIVTDADDATTPAQLRSFMLNTRYW